VLITTGGTFKGSGTPCLRGYANTSGTMSITGNLQAGEVPDLGGLGAFRGRVEQLSWRELYQ